MLQNQHIHNFRHVGSRANFEQEKCSMREVVQKGISKLSGKY